MSADIAKLCVESLRAYARDELGFKLKAAHAHEIVAAFFGYKSRIALLSDEALSLEKLESAEFIVLDLPIALVDQRRSDLEGLSPDLPASQLLAKGIHSIFAGQEWALGKMWPNLGALAKHLAQVRLLEHVSIRGLNLGSVNLEISVSVRVLSTEAVAEVAINYHADGGEVLRDSSYVIRLPRVAANIGYGRPHIEETRYTGQFRKLSLPAPDQAV